jgi:hypothetical protein
VERASEPLKAFFSYWVLINRLSISFALPSPLPSGVSETGLLEAHQTLFESHGRRLHEIWQANHQTSNPSRA